MDSATSPPFRLVRIGLEAADADGNVSADGDSVVTLGEPRWIAVLDGPIVSVTLVVDRVALNPSDRSLVARARDGDDPDPLRRTGTISRIDAVEVVPVDQHGITLPADPIPTTLDLLFAAGDGVLGEHRVYRPAGIRGLD